MVLLLALILGVVVIGGVIALTAMLASRGAQSSSREVLAARAASAPAPSGGPISVPAEWGWARIKDRGEKSVGYYYRDRMAGPSFHVLYEEAAAPSQEELREMRYRGSLTKRLGAHQTMQIPEGLSPEAAGPLVSMLTSSFESAGATGTAILKLTKAERDQLGLPDAPPWIEVYLR